MLQNHDAFLEAQCAEEESKGRTPSVILLIKELREHSQMGLKEAKDIVDDFLRRRRIRAQSALEQYRVSLSPQTGLQDHSGWLREHIARLEAANQTPTKISLIRDLREHTNLGLAEAKDIVEDFLEGRPLSALPSVVHNLDTDTWLREHIAQLEAARQKPQYISLIKDVREHTNLGLKEAKDIVDAFCARERPDIHGGLDGDLFGNLKKMFGLE